MKEKYRPLAFFIAPIFWLVSIVTMVENLALGITLNVICIIGVIALFLPISRPKIPGLNVEAELEQVYQRFYETVIFPKERQRKIKGFGQKVLKLLSVIVILITAYSLIIAITDDDKYLPIFGVRVNNFYNY